MTRAEAVWHANHVFNIVIERCINAQNLKEAREFDEAKQIVIEALEQEPKQGKWIQAKDVEKEYAVCTNCKHHGEFYMDYCPNCGAKMESDTE
jgi:acetyl-CoA carboxylase beta subunit